MRRLIVGKEKYEVLVDDDVPELLEQLGLTVRTHKGSHGRYAYVSLKTALLHRFLMGLKVGDGMLVDHKNHNTLDNRRENLRVCTKSQNTMYTRRRPNKSGYRGVRYRKGKWDAVVTKDYQHHHVGRFNSAELAAKAYDRKAIELFGDYAMLNFPPNEQVAG